MIWYRQEIDSRVRRERKVGKVSGTNKRVDKRRNVSVKIMIATIKSWNIERAEKLQRQQEGVHDIRLITKKEELTYNNICDFNPDYIFFPHWSYYIPQEITDTWECVVFHMTDLPYGRGGSPLQNLIVRGHKDTKISALRVTAQLDGGPIYMKRPLSLEGTAQEIFIRCSEVIFQEMIPCFLDRKPEAVPQSGEPVVFKRRKPEDSEITCDMELNVIYDYIRMLDAEGYPRAYIDYGGYRLSFEEAKLDDNGELLEAKVTFQKREGG